ncbi:MAG: alanine dehydrogenase [Bacteroidales bacterium]|nr:alanine dehydrogenase [Bacteroidales bacterium]
MDTKSKSTPQFTFGKSVLLPQEEMLETGKKQKKLIIGVPKEISPEENRIPLAPHAVERLVNNGHTVLIEKKAGEGAHFDDLSYSEVGGIIVNNHNEIFESDIIIKIAPLQQNEIELLKANQTIISSLHIAAQTKEYIQNLLSKKTTALAFEYLKDKRNNIYPIIRSMSEIAGSTSILIAAEYLSNINNGKGEMLGGISAISPSEVVIIGAGTAGEFAARTALGLGALVKVFDSSIRKLSQLQNNIGTRIFTSMLQPRVLQKALKSADVVIGALHLGDPSQRFIVSEDIVKIMKPDSVIVDISIDHGGCFETSKLTSHSNPVYKKHNVIHYCVPNIPSRVARTASYALSNIFGQIILNIGEAGGTKQLLKNNLGVRNGVYIYNGILTNEYIGEKFGLSYRDINLLMAAF